jgi:lipopolysaccharide export system protein LptC
MSHAPYRFYLLLIVTTLMSWWLVKLTGVDESNTISNAVHSPDYFAQDYSKWTMDAQGKLKEQLIADKVSHYDDNTTQLSQPSLLTFANSTPKKTAANKDSMTNKEPQGAAWLIKAEQGLLSADGKQLELTNKVFINRVNTTKKANALTINTSNLHVELDSHKAETKEWVELLSPPQKTTAIGMKVVFIEPIVVRLLARVQGKYEVH